MEPDKILDRNGNEMCPNKRISCLLDAAGKHILTVEEYNFSNTIRMRDAYTGDGKVHVSGDEGCYTIIKFNDGTWLKV